MALSDDITTRLGSALLVELTNFDDATATTTNTARLDAAIEDAQGAIRRGAGLTAPSDTTTAEYDSYRELVLLGTEYYLHLYRSRASSETAESKRMFDEALQGARMRADIAIQTSAVVDVENEDQDDRKARFSPDTHFGDFRIK